MFSNLHHCMSITANHIAGVYRCIKCECGGFGRTVQPWSVCMFVFVSFNVWVHVGTCALLSCLCLISCNWVCVELLWWICMFVCVSLVCVCVCVHRALFVLFSSRPQGQQGELQSGVQQSPEQHRQRHEEPGASSVEQHGLGQLQPHAETSGHQSQQLQRHLHPHARRQSGQQGFAGQRQGLPHRWHTDTTAACCVLIINTVYVKLASLIPAECACENPSHQHNLAAHPSCQNHDLIILRTRGKRPKSCCFFYL